MEIYRTETYYIRFDDAREEVYIKDLKDVYNETSGYNTKKRGYKAFKQTMLDIVKMGDCSSFSTIIRLADMPKYSLRMHTYCAMD
jgi:hypothetical protein